MKAIGKKWTGEVLRKVVPWTDKVKRGKGEDVTPEIAWNRLESDGGAVRRLYPDAFENREECFEYLTAALEQDIRAFKLMILLFDSERSDSPMLRGIALVVAARKPKYLLLIPPEFFFVDFEALTIKNDDILLRAVQNDASFMEFVPEELRAGGTVFSKKAVEINPRAVKYLHDVDLELASKAVASDNRALLDLSDDVANRLVASGLLTAPPETSGEGSHETASSTASPGLPQSPLRFEPSIPVRDLERPHTNHPVVQVPTSSLYHTSTSSSAPTTSGAAEPL